MEQFPKVTVIVPARNEEKVIGKCLESLLGSDYPKEKLDVIVAIDGSKDGTEKIARSFEPGVRVIVSSPKKCKADAINAVLPMANGEVIAIYDADCILDGQCIRNAVKHFSNPKIAGVSGTLKSYNKDQSVIAKALSIETCFISYVEKFLNNLGANAHFLGKNMFIRKDVLLDMGSFNVNSFSEDAELSLRLKRYKNNWYDVAFEDSAVTWHEEPSTFKSFWNQRKRWTRGLVQIVRTKRRESPKMFLSDAMHGIYFYASPFGLIIGTLLAIAWFLNLPIYIFAPLFGLFLFNMSLLVYSRIHFKESMRDLLYFPVWFALSNIQSVLAFKSLFDDLRGKEISWFRVERSTL
jgi:cellulose synthase/poly-beta-1,6-N-acetylglucosamine synthase-like glycosyltransferase